MRLSLLFTFFLLASSCNSKHQRQGPPPKEQLNIRAAQFNQFLRWKAIDRAKYLVLPKERIPFISNWENRFSSVEITSFKIRDISIKPEKNKKKPYRAEVLIVRTQYRKDRLLLTKLIILQHWQAKGGFWFFVSEEPYKAPRKIKADKKSRIFSIQKKK